MKKNIIKEISKSNRVKWLHLRLSPTEHQLLVKKKANSTCRSLSQYTRALIFDRPIVTTYRNLSQDDIIQEMAVLNRELNAIGNNINQITKRFHTLRPSEEKFWSSQFSVQVETILGKISEIKELAHKIAERWLR